jgi:hypothetical protein
MNGILANTERLSGGTLARRGCRLPSAGGGWRTEAKPVRRQGDRRRYEQRQRDDADAQPSLHCGASGCDGRGTTWAADDHPAAVIDPAGERELAGDAITAVNRRNCLAPIRRDGLNRAAGDASICPCSTAQAKNTLQWVRIVCA